MPLHYDIETSYLYNLGIQKEKDNSKKILKALEQKNQEEKKALQQKNQEEKKALQQKNQEEKKALERENIRNLLKLGTLSQKQIAQALKVSPYLVRKVKKEMQEKS